MPDLLAALEPTTPPLDEQALTEAIFERAWPEVESIANDDDLTVEPPGESDIDAFATEQIDVLAISFGMVGPLTDLSPSDRTGEYRVAGQATYRLSSKAVESVFLEGIDVTRTDEYGEELTTTRVGMAAASLFQGTRREPLRIKRPIGRRKDAPPS